MIETLLETQSPLGEPIAVYKNRWSGADPDAESLSIVSGLHGDRVTGLYAMSRLTRFLDEVQAGTAEGYRLTGTVQLFPVVNLRAMESGSAVWSMDSLNTDLAFPGTIEGELTEKVCNTLLHHSARSDFGLILKTAPSGYVEALHVELYKPDRSLRNLARTVGMSTARLVGDSPEVALQLVKHWRDCHIQTLTLSAGPAHRLDRRQGDALYEGILNFMLMTGLLTHPTVKGSKNEVAFYNPKGERSVLANHAGLFIGESDPGPVKAGQTLGEIRGLYEGKTLETISAPEDGFLVSLRENPLVCEGEVLGNLLTVRYPRWFWPFS